jgi:ATP-dependent Clp protease adaptor protein ClpS
MAGKPDGEGGSGVITRTRTEKKVERPKLWKVLFHNDDYTTREFVVWVLRTVFHKSESDAVTIMLHVHRSGVGVAGLYPHDVAETKVKKVQELAHEHEYPLLVTMEPED